MLSKPIILLLNCRNFCILPLVFLHKSAFVYLYFYVFHKLGKLQCDASFIDDFHSHGISYFFLVKCGKILILHMVLAITVFSEAW